VPDDVLARAAIETGRFCLDDRDDNEFENEPVYLAPGSALDRWRARDEAYSAATAVLSTGIPALNSRLPDRGLVPGFTMVIAGAPGSGKTSLGFEIEESALASGWLVLHWAIDEAPKEIKKRRELRHGHSFAPDNLLHPSEDQLLDDVWLNGTIREDPRDLLIFVDSMQNVHSKNTLGQTILHERLAALFDDIRRCQSIRPAVLVMTSEVNDGGSAKGGTKIAHASRVLISVSVVHEHDHTPEVRVRFEKNRGFGASKAPFNVIIDRDSQRIFDPSDRKACAKKSKARSNETRKRIKEDILSHVRVHGASAKRQIEEAVTGNNSQKRGVLQELLDTGTLTVDAEGLVRAHS
jgi:predicted ATP-dependent serine protease